MENSSIYSALAGLAGSMSNIAFYPLEFAKVNFIAGDGHSQNFLPHYRSTKEAILSLYKTQGFLSLYRGCHISLFSSVAWTLYFYIYDKAKHRYISFKDSNPNLYKFTVASEAAILSRIITSPLWTIKTRLILQHNPTYWFGDTLEAIKKVWMIDGPKGYFAGLVPGLLLCSNGILNLYFYEIQKELFNSPSALSSGLYGMNSKLLSSLVTYPIQLVMIKLQQEQYKHTILHKSSAIPQGFHREKFFKGSVHCIQKTYSNEGFKGFYRGLTLQLMRTIPGNGLFFILYEYTLAFLGSK